jgi:uncharacterized RDD family membrane protein YckC
MPQDGVDLTHDVERVDVSMFSETQCDMLWMRLRSRDVMHVFDGHHVTVPATRAVDLSEAVDWVRKEVRSPPPRHYPQPHPFERTAGRGVVVAARWRRVVATLIDSVVLTILSAAAHRLGASHRLVAVLDALYIIVMTWTWGRTVGKFLMEIRVVDANRRRPNLRQSIVRWAAVGWIGIAADMTAGSANKLLLVAELAIYAPALFDPLGRGLHDHVAGTMVMSTARRR